MRRQRAEKRAEEVVAEPHLGNTRAEVPHRERRTGNQADDEHRLEAGSLHLRLDDSSGAPEFLEDAFAEKSADEIGDRGAEDAAAHPVEAAELPSPNHARGDDEDRGGRREDTADRVGGDECNRRVPRSPHRLDVGVQMFAVEMISQRREVNRRDHAGNEQHHRDLDRGAFVH